jgi:3-methyladenine DNA glycosylase/8-oxoguanine DNA glycosylase
MVKLAERWRLYRSLATGYLFASEYEPLPTSVANPAGQPATNKEEQMI